ncbi:MAG TPA: carboxypeptidase-like regulatory domain-containing protein [Bryobacteraceae bacterium]|nr:carboxypeptidase-like regulatory domain-containing protein [Bryobacteraceae bacterium]
MKLADNNPMSQDKVVVLVALACATIAFAQTGAVIRGTAVDSDGAAVANAQVQAVNAGTKSVYRTTGSAKGEFTLTGLPSGDYDVNIVAPGYYAINKHLTVGKTDSSHLDVRLLEYQLGTLGDGREFRVQLTSPHDAPSGPAPRTADGKPDLTGVWYAQRTIDPGKPEPLPWAQKLLAERAANNGKDAPGARCLPRGITNAGALFPFKLVQTAALLVMLFEDDIPSHRQVFLDGRRHPADPNPQWMGHSVGYWEGDTLVIDTVGFDDRSWLDTAGHPHTEKMHVIERFRRPDLGHLQIEFTIDDPETYAKPWKIERAAELDTTGDIGEYVCTEDEKDVQHMVGK